ncbi:MAG: molybdenum cofactor guanylyltransferase, partial [Desulfobacterales bacterium]|nr:molybdenum cofactor guanylyltransferase [Desulfobacterales bacterium]
DQVRHDDFKTFYETINIDGEIPNMKYPCSGVILAGGLSTRFSGQNKAFISIGGKRILDHIYEVFNKLFTEIILVTNDPIKYLEWDLNIGTDLFPIRSSLTGIHAGLFYSTNPYSFFIACDTPFLKTEMAEAIVNSIEPGVDIVLPETSEGIQPLCAVYSKQCLKYVEGQLTRKELQIRRFFKKVRIKKLPENLLQKNDPDLLSFFNINTPDDLAKAEKIVQNMFK